jgi:hypothetical protein
MGGVAPLSFAGRAWWASVDGGAVGGITLAGYLAAFGLLPTPQGFVWGQPRRQVCEGGDGCASVAVCASAFSDMRATEMNGTALMVLLPTELQEMNGLAVRVLHPSELRDMNGTAAMVLHPSVQGGKEKVGLEVRRARQEGGSMWP